ncbi:fibrinogen-like protein 1 [Lampris incognitus]|uniref:fibrinogen-like protein 1 n=1 Tax=Lampris incognitus TaxID=2546036 RepID=UPI0024B49EF5|nr:fibrinogen-like protein 1 [Lampris incognitus]
MRVAWVRSGVCIGGGGGGSHCGEFSSQVTQNRQCRLMATLPTVGSQGKRCPDIFRCSDEVSHWLHENQDRKEKLEDLRETISGLQEELRNHRHRIKALEMQGESIDVNSSIDAKLHSLELHQEEANALLHVHAALLYQLQAELQNLSSFVERLQRNPACMVNVLQPGTFLGLQGARHPDVHHMTSCPVDCASLYYNGVHRSGVYTLVPSLGATPLEVYCDMETEGGGWTVFQRRRDGSVSFNRGWREYRDGFGEPQGEHWLGNRHLHLLSTQGHYSLRIDLEDWTHKHRYALYQSFSTEDEQNQFRLHVSGFSGTVEDSFGWYHDKQAFSSPDTGNICAEISHAGWWYNQCFYANLNGVYYKGGRYLPKVENLLGPDGIVWFSWKDSDYYSLKAVSMMIRPRGFRPRLSP